MISSSGIAMYLHSEGCVVTSCYLGECWDTTEGCDDATCGGMEAVCGP